MKQLTIRGFDEELLDRIEELARQEGLSLNRAVLRLLRKGAGLERPSRSPEVVGDSMDELIGTWTEEEATQVLDAVADFDEIDEAMWR